MKECPIIRGAFFILLILFWIGCAHSPPISNVNEKPVKIREFIISPGDELEVFVWRHPDLTRTVKVDPWGNIFLPLVGELKAEGLSIKQIQKEIINRLSRYLVDPHVIVSVRTYQAYKVAVLGEVKKPSVFPLDHPLRITEAISMAGGFTLDAKQTSVIVIRGQGERPTLIKLDIKRSLTSGDPSQDIYLQAGDIVYVPASIVANLDRFFDHLEKALRPFIDIGIGAIIWHRIQEWD